MEDSRISLGQWLLALWLVCDYNFAISSYEVARRIGITQKSAWLMLKRIRKALDLTYVQPPVNGSMVRAETNPI